MIIVEIMLISYTPEEQKILKTLESSLSPFEKFVAKIDIEEKLPLVSDRKAFILDLIETLNLSDPHKIIPIIGDTGLGKTFLLWEINNSIDVKTPAIFINVPEDAKSFYYTIYTQIIQKLGAHTLRDLTNKITNLWGAHNLKFGLFRISNTQKIEERALESIRFRWSRYRDELRQIIHVLITHAIDPEKMQLAERWLLGDRLERDDLFFLGVEKDLLMPNMAKELLRMLMDYYEEGVIIMFDDLDKTWSQYNAYASELDDLDWTDTPQQKSPDSKIFEESPAFFKELATLLADIHNIKIILTTHQENHQQLLDYFPKLLKLFIHPPLNIPAFTQNDTKFFYSKAMEQYFRTHALEPLPDAPYFPLTEKILELIQIKHKGNPREIVRQIQKIFDDIIFTGQKIQEIELTLIQ